MFADYDFEVIRSSLPYLFREGMVFTVTLTLIAMSGGIVFGTLLAMMRLSSLRPLAALAGGYVNLMRSVPLVLVIFWFFFLVPYIGAWLIGASRPIAVGAFWSAAITFTLFEAAYYCEIMRAGIQSIPRGQVWSAYALGLSYWQAMGQVVLPQAFRNMLPVLVGLSIGAGEIVVWPRIPPLSMCGARTPTYAASICRKTVRIESRGPCGGRIRMRRITGRLALLASAPRRVGCLPGPPCRLTLLCSRRLPIFQRPFW